MSSYLPPIENLPTFNSSLFNQDTGTGLTQAQTDTLYLSKKNTDTSTAPLTTFNNAVTIGGNVILGQTTITDGQNLNARQILSSNTTALTAHSLFTNMGSNSVLTIGNSNASIQTNGSLTPNGPLNMKANSNCELTFSADIIAVRVATGSKNFWINATATATLNIGNILAPLNLNASTFTIAGTTAVFNSGVTCNNGLTANGVTAADFDTSNPTSLSRICNSTSSGTIRLGAALTSLGNLEIGSNTGNNTIKGPTLFSQSATFTSTGTTNFNCILALNENVTFASLKTTTFNGTTIFNGTNTFNTGDTSFPARMILRGGQYANEVFDTGINTAYTFGSLPIQQRIIISTTTNINITLPTITNSAHAGLEFTFIKTGSITNSVTFTRGGTNLIYSASTITNQSPYTTMVNTDTTKVFIILEVSAGIFVWKEIL